MNYSDFEELAGSPFSRCSCREMGRLCDYCQAIFEGPSGHHRAMAYAFQEEKAKKTTLPPTEKQLERINQLKDLPEFQEHLDWLLEAINKGMLNTRGQAGILINEMKKKCGVT
jgi:hypothetical protein